MEDVRTGETDGRKDERRGRHRVEVTREACQPARIVVVSGALGGGSGGGSDVAINARFDK